MKRQIGWASVWYVGGWAWNYYLFELGGGFGDWIRCGRWMVCVGDLMYLLSFALLLSVPFRERVR
jgi:hypothetical protein